MASALPPFSSRKTILTACDMLKALGHSGLDRFLVELGLPDPDVGTGSGLMARTTSLARYAIEHPDAITAEGQPLAAAIVAEAGDIYRQGIMVNITEKEHEAFQRASAGDGSMSDVTNPTWYKGQPPALLPSGLIPTFGTLDFVRR